MRVVDQGRVTKDVGGGLVTAVTGQAIMEILQSDAATAVASSS